MTGAMTKRDWVQMMEDPGRNTRGRHAIGLQQPRLRPQPGHGNSVWVSSVGGSNPAIRVITLLPSDALGGSWSGSWSRASNPDTLYQPLNPRNS